MKFEYQGIESNMNGNLDKVVKELNKLGAQGWEAFAVVSVGVTLAFNVLLKREIGE